MYPIKQSTAEIILFFAHDENGDAITGLTDGSFTKRISKGSGAWAAMTATISEDENGWYKFTLSTTHSNATGILTIVLTNGGAKQVNLQFRVDAKLIDDLQDITTAQVNTECDTSMTDYGANTITPDNTSIAAILVDTADLQANQGNWLTATGFATSAALSTVDANIDSIIIDTGTDIPALINGLNDLAGSEILTTALAESYSADGAAPTLSQAIFLILQFLYERNTAGTAVTVKKLDGATTAAGLTLDSATTPTSITRSS